MEKFIPKCTLCFDKKYITIEKESGQPIRGIIEDWNFTFGWRGPIEQKPCPACNPAPQSAEKITEPEPPKKFLPFPPGIFEVPA